MVRNNSSKRCRYQNVTKCSTVRARMISNRFLAYGCALSGVGLLGCPNTEGEYNNFGERYDAINNVTASSSTGAGGGCAAPSKVGELDGEFLFVLSAKPAGAKKPVLFDTKLTTAMGASGLEFSMDFQPLQAVDRKTPVGTPLKLGPYPISKGGGFDAKFPPLTVVGDANPILPGQEITAEVEIIGKFCAPADFVCGIVNGNVTKPVPIDLSKPQSTFTMTRLTTPGAYPEPPKINCAGELAEPKK